MKLPYSAPATCWEPVTANLCFLVGSNEGYDVDVVDPGFSTPNYYEWL